MAQPNISNALDSVNPGELNPEAQGQTEEEKSVVRLVEKLLSQAKRSRQSADQKWMDYYRFFRGKQWKEKRPSYRNSEVLNYIFSEVQNVLVLMTDSRPRIDVLPEDPTDTEFAQILSEIITAKWDANRWADVLAEAIIDTAIYGTAIGEVAWKPELLDGIGDYDFDTVDPFHFFPDPSARSEINDEHCQYVVTAVPTDVGRVKRMYPDKADLIKPDLSDLSGGNFDPYDTQDIQLKSPTDNRVMVDSYRPNGSNKPNQVLLITAYIKSYDKVEELIGEEKDPDTGLTQKFYQDKFKHPNGRKIVIANQILLTPCEGDDNPYVNGKFPFAKMVDHIMPREFWGIGEVEQLKSPSEIVNKIISYALDVLLLMGNPIWVVDTEANIETQNLTNQPGLIVEKTKGSEVRREAGVQLQPFVLEMFTTMTERVMGKLGSTTDVSKGVSPPGASGFAIEQLQDAAQTRIRGKTRNMESFLKQAGELQIDRILQYYTVPRVVRLTNNEGAAKYFKFHITDSADEKGDVKKVATIQNYVKDPSTGQMVAQGPIEVQLKSKLDIKVDVGSSLGFAKAKRAEDAKQLFQFGILNPEELLDALDYPGKEKIIERIKSQPPMPPMAPGKPGAPNAGPNAAPIA